MFGSVRPPALLVTEQCSAIALLLSPAPIASVHDTWHVSRVVCTGAFSKKVLLADFWDHNTRLWGACSRRLWSGAPVLSPALLLLSVPTALP